MAIVMLRYLISLIFVLLAIGYYLLPIPYLETVSLFLSAATFLFAIFAGFFISRQGTRYSKIRELIADFDGGLSAIYRNIGHFGAKHR